MGLIKAVFITKTSLFNILKILPLKKENFQIKILIFFHNSTQKHRLWVHIRTATVRRF